MEVTEELAKEYLEDIGIKDFYYESVVFPTEEKDYKISEIMVNFAKSLKSKKALTAREKCDRCHGSGYLTWGTWEENCPKCGGLGVMVIKIQ